MSILSSFSQSGTKSATSIRFLGCYTLLLLHLLSFALLVCVEANPNNKKGDEAPTLSVIGNRLVTLAPATSSASSTERQKYTATPIQLRGVDTTGANFECVQGRGIFDGPTDDSFIAGMLSWNVTVVRIPMNEQCWLGVNNINPLYSGAAYQAAIKTYIARLLDHGLTVIVTLHWSAPGTYLATGQQPMPDRDHSIPFWREMSRAFGSDRRIIFDVFNEPFPYSNTVDDEQGWKCWANGGGSTDIFARGDCPTINYAAVGMKELVHIIRTEENATNVLMLGGINYANHLGHFWLKYQPSDPLNRTAASWHSYATNYCNTESCWNSTILPVINSVPVVVGEMGENDCKGKYIEPLAKWLMKYPPPPSSSSSTHDDEEFHRLLSAASKAEGGVVVEWGSSTTTSNGGGTTTTLGGTGAGGGGTSFLAWLWANWDCKTGPSLIVDYNGTCTDSYGCVFKKMLNL